MSLDFHTCLLFVFISQLGSVTSDRCPNECVWGSWSSWHCEQCCQVWSGRNAAYRFRSICCSAEPDINSCLKKCNFHQNQTTDNGMCTSYCPCYRIPTVIPQMAWPSKIPVTVTPTPAHPNLPPLYQTRSMTRVSVAHDQTTNWLQGNGRAVLHLMEFIDGTVSYDRVVSNRLGEDAGGEQSREDKCLAECRDRSDLYNCLVKCILSPCETIVMIAGPCLFVLGIIVGSSITCCITRIMRKNRDKKENTKVQPFKAALNF